MVANGNFQAIFVNFSGSIRFQNAQFKPAFCVKTTKFENVLLKSLMVTTKKSRSTPRLSIIQENSYKLQTVPCPYRQFAHPLKWLILWRKKIYEIHLNANGMQKKLLYSAPGSKQTSVNKLVDNMGQCLGIKPLSMEMLKKCWKIIFQCVVLISPEERVW